MQPEDLFAGRYRLERELARGGMGSVWVAEDVHLSRPVAIKFMGDALEGIDAEQRFRREAAAAAQLRTRHVVEIFDHGVADGRPFIVMELLEGESLSSLLRRHGRLPLATCASLLAQIGKGLRAAHEAQFVHRDLKPQNIFLSRDSDGDETVKILDFGVAKDRRLQTPDEATATGVLLGSPHYMSPEQSRGVREVDHRSDLWSVAVILYRSLTGKRPWESESIVDLLVIICTEPFKPATHWVPDLPPAIDGFFERALAVDPSARFDSIDELLAAFGEAANVGFNTTGPHPLISPASGPRLSLPSLEPLPSPVPDGAPQPSRPSHPGPPPMQAAPGQLSPQNAPEPATIQLAPTIRRDPIPEVADAGTLRGATANYEGTTRRHGLSWLVGLTVAAGLMAIVGFTFYGASDEVDRGTPAASGAPAGSEPEPPEVSEPAPTAEDDPPAGESADDSADDSAPATSATATASAEPQPTRAPKPAPAAKPTWPRPKVAPRPRPPSPPKPRPGGDLPMY